MFAQWASELQLVRHTVVLPQMYAPQVVVGAWVQVPVPEQNDCGWNVPALQDTARPHETVAAPFVQAPLVQVPVLPHGALAGHWPAGAAVPVARFVQVPGVVPAQVWQVGQLVLPAGSEQQTPLTQLPLMHWLAAVHATPGGLSAQLRLGGVPWQVNGGKQWLSIEQLVRQPVVSQT